MQDIKLAWRAIAQTAMWPLLVVVSAPITDLSPGIKQVLKPTHSQAFLAQFSMEALHLRILRRFAKFYMSFRRTFNEISERGESYAGTHRPHHSGTGERRALFRES